MDLFNPFDAGFSMAVNCYVGHMRFFDALMHGFTNNYLLKSANQVALLYFAWFASAESPAVHPKLGGPRPGTESLTNSRIYLLCGLLAAVTGPVAARALTAVLPFRPRPMHEMRLKLVLPDYMRPEIDLNWSSFPSDTTALIAPLAIAVTVAVPGLGWLAIPMMLMAAFARVYSGLHYLTDMMAGAALGITALIAFTHTPLRQAVARPASVLYAKNRPLFYTLFFLLSYEVANVFWESFTLLRYLFPGLPEARA